VNISNLLVRLKTLEAEFLRLAATELANDFQSIRSEYQARLEQLENSHSRSWFGDHSATYYKDFQAPPAGRSFDVEWGFIPGFNGSRNSGWRIYSRDEIRSFVFKGFGEQIFFEMDTLAERVQTEMSSARNQALDVLEAISQKIKSKALDRYTQTVENDLKSYSPTDYVNGKIKSTPRMTRDSEELAKGQAVPAQVMYMSSFQSVDVNKRRASDIAVILRNVIELASLHSEEPTKTERRRRIFIGHGRSEQWRILKDFVRDRLNLEHDEFNRISPAGLNTQERLTEMLAQCGFAFLVMTGEDMDASGLLHPRENVIHEAGLFQGELGWRRAIVLLEEGCEEFSNITGLGQIRFQKGNISSCFEEVRRVLERESILA
jgi:predicted nucleotide-binding protein